MLPAYRRQAIFFFSDKPRRFLKPTRFLKPREIKKYLRFKSGLGYHHLRTALTNQLADTSSVVNIRESIWAGSPKPTRFTLNSRLKTVNSKLLLASLQQS